MKKIVDTPGPDSDPQWSPDGKQIAYATSNGEKYFFYANQKIAVVDANGGKPRVVSEAFDEDPDLLKWAPEGMYFSGLQKMSSALYLLDPANGKLKKMAMPGSEIAGSFTFSKDFKQVAYRGAGANQYAEIYASALAAGSPAKLTNAGAQEAGFSVAKREVVRWKSGDGTEIEGVLYKPADFSPSEEVSAAGGDSWRADGNRYAVCQRRSLLPDGAICGARARWCCGRIIAGRRDTARSFAR